MFWLTRPGVLVFSGPSLTTCWRSGSVRSCVTTSWRNRPSSETWTKVKHLIFKDSRRSTLKSTGWNTWCLLSGAGGDQSREDEHVAPDLLDVKLLKCFLTSSYLWCCVSNLNCVCFLFAEQNKLLSDHIEKMAAEWGRRVLTPKMSSQLIIVTNSAFHCCCICVVSCQDAASVLNCVVVVATLCVQLLAIRCHHQLVHDVIGKTSVTRF